MLSLSYEDSVQANNRVESRHVVLEKTTVLLFIDAAVDDIQTLVDGTQPGVSLVVLDPQRDGLEQITAILCSQPEVSDIHIVAHGAPGCLYLGRTELSLETLSHYAPMLTAWRTLSGRLYRCMVAI